MCRFFVTDDLFPYSISKLSYALQVYQKHAQKLEAAGDYSKAASFHGKCLAASKAAGDKIAEGKANYLLGRATIKINQPAEALLHLDNYVSIHSILIHEC